ncbi:RAF-like serine/threonine-protein kinase PRAF [Primulina eburnea]|uniref:RAF-like serine/threonine-protein kinase PRAF n=1 Tax=Primulina eburnea TaxID=1245227 RepID=UPI003C6C680F
MNCTTRIKFLYSYGGKIIPGSSETMLRYIGGYTRVLTVDRCVKFSELMVKFGESCGSSVRLKCKLPSEDLDILVSIKSDEDLRNVIEEYDRVSPEAKIRAVLFPTELTKKVSPPTSPMSCFDFPAAPKPSRKTTPISAFHCTAPSCAAVHHFYSPAVGYPIASEI